MTAPTIWTGCYNDSWNGVIVGAAFQHPAKFARGLIRRIYEHMIAAGYLVAGDTVIDPFGGVGLGGLDAMTLGLYWTGVELEDRFVTLGCANIEKWSRDLAMLNGRLGTARIVQGDSRRLVEVVGGHMAASISSPPFEDSDNRGAAAMPDGYFVRPDGTPFGEGAAIRALIGDSPGQLGNLRGGFKAAISSSPFSGDKNLMVVDDQGVRSDMVARRGMVESDTQQSPGNLAALRADSAGFNAAVSSPPYADAINSSGEGPGARHDPVHHVGDNAFKASSDNGYGDTPGNLGGMAGDGWDAAVSSPPFGGEAQHTGGPMPTKHYDGRKAPRVSSGMVTGAAPYGVSDGQLAREDGETFWSAARLICEQTYAVLRPGGYAVWVTKRFVRDKQIVEFSEQWAQLCEAVGFVRIEWIYAMLTEEHGHQLDLFGGSHPKGVKRASFFRRLYEKKYPENAIDWEDVIVMRKPEAAP